MKKPVVKILFDGRNLKDKSYSVKLAVYFDGKQKLFPTGLVLQDKDVSFLKANKDGLSGRVKDIDSRELWHRVYGDGYTDPKTGVRYESHLLKGVKAAAQVEEYFTYEIFASVLAGNFIPEGKTSTDSDMIKALTNRAKILKLQGDISNGNLYESTASSLSRYSVHAKLARTTKTAHMPIQIVTPQLLREYERWMLKSGKMSKTKDGKGSPAALTTVAIYARNIRKICMDAKKSKLITEEAYPFGESGYKIPAVANKKKALDFDVLTQIFQYKTKTNFNRDKRREKWRDMWLFIYLGNGLNTMDVCNIKKKNVDYRSGTIEFFRDKTMETKRQGMSQVRIFLTPEIIEIINKHQNPDPNPEAFLFPFLPMDVTPDQEKKLVNQVTRNINAHMNRISKELGLNVQINTYQARHSFATTLLRSEAPLAFISQALGHSSLSTTQKYLGSFEIDQTKKYMSALVPKKKEEENK